MYVAEKKSQFYVVDRLTGKILAEVCRHPPRQLPGCEIGMMTGMHGFRGLDMQRRLASLSRGP